MKDHSFYILMSYGVFALVLVIELYALRVQRNRVLHEAGQMSEAMHAGPHSKAAETGAHGVVDAADSGEGRIRELKRPRKDPQHQGGAL